MVGSEFLDYISKFQVATYVGVEDFADKFNFLVTVMILLLCTTVVTVKQYMMKPISCYMATDIGGKNLLDYVENYCWVQGTIPIAYAGKMPETDAAWEEMEKHKLLYYQWVPFVLGLQCIMFYVPRVIWQMICYNRTGTDIQHLVLSANQAVHATDDQRTKMIQHVARTLEQMLFQRTLWKHQRARAMSRNRYIQLQTAKIGQRSTVTAQPSLEQERVYGYGDVKQTSPKYHTDREYSGLADELSEPKSKSLIGLCCYHLWRTVCFIHLDHHRGTFLSLAYLLMKLLYLANAVSQLLLMQYFLGFREYGAFFGVVLLHNILSGKDWQATLIFPRVAYCYAPIKHLGTTTNTAVAQCVLPVNMLNEKIYIFLWWWVFLIIIITALSLLRWCLRTASSVKGTDFVKKYLMLSDVAIPIHPCRIDEFCRRFLRRDGVFLLRMIAENAGEMIASEILHTLWLSYDGLIDLSRSHVDNEDLQKSKTGFDEIAECGPTKATAPSAETAKSDVNETVNPYGSLREHSNHISLRGTDRSSAKGAATHLIVGEDPHTDPRFGSYV